MAKLIPARYIGHHAINLVAGLGPFFNADGSRRQSLTVEHGDILLMPEREILGQTYLFDPRGSADPLDLGAGKRVKAEHATLSDEELSQLGYEFHQGRADFEHVSDAELAALKRQAQVEGDASEESAPAADEMQPAPAPAEQSSAVRGG